MGVSTDAIVFYGYVWDDESDDTERLIEIYDKDSSVEAASHCSIDFPLLYIYIKESRKVATRGYACKLGSDIVGQMIYVPQLDEWRRELDAWCSRHKVNMDDANGPDWWLVSDWS